MKQIMPNMTRFNFLIPLLCALLIMASPSRAQDDSIRVEKLLVMDTVALEIKGPSIDVTFYLNGIVFLSNTKYHPSYRTYMNYTIHVDYKMLSICSRHSTCGAHFLL